MLKNLVLFAIAATLVVGIGYADQSRPAAKVVVQVTKTSPATANKCIPVIAPPATELMEKGMARWRPLWCSGLPT